MFSPEGVLHPVMEVLFGEAREFTARILLLFDWGGEEKWRSRLVNVQELVRGQAWLTLYPDSTH